MTHRGRGTISGGGNANDGNNDNVMKVAVLVVAGNGDNISGGDRGDISSEDGDGSDIIGGGGGDIKLQWCGVGGSCDNVGGDCGESHESAIVSSSGDNDGGSDL